jgi:hypothetical protein
MMVTERAGSLDLRRGSHLLALLGSTHVLGSLYNNAQNHRNQPWLATDVAVYLAAAVGILLLGPWRGRRQFLLAGLAGLALGSHLLLDLRLVARAPFVLGLGLVGLAVALGTYAYLHFRPRSGGGG